MPTLRPHQIHETDIVLVEATVGKYLKISKENSTERNWTCRFELTGVYLLAEGPRNGRVIDAVGVDFDIEEN